MLNCLAGVALEKWLGGTYICLGVARRTYACTQTCVM